MKTAILIHGCYGKKEFLGGSYPSLSNSHWFGWLQKELLKKGILTQTPEMPEPYRPVYKKWKEVFESFHLDSHSVLIGRSCGAGFLLRWLGENKIRIQKLVLVAPWLDPSRKRNEFLHFSIDPAMQGRIKTIHVLISDDERVEGVKTSVVMIRKTLPGAKLHEFRGMGHFTYGRMKTVEFPAL